MKIDRQDKDSLNATLVMTVEKSDYLDKFNEELKKYKSKVQLKGFRKGKTPLSSIRKMYGKGALAELINEQIQENLNNYIKENKLELLGNPIAAVDQEMVDFNLNNLEDYEFKFDIGLAPDFEVAGLNDDTTFENYGVIVPDSIIEEELDMRRRRMGTTSQQENDIEENDILTINANEIENGKIKTKGWETEFSILVSKMEDTVKEEVLKLKKGDKFKFDVNDIEKGATEKHVRQYILHIENEDSTEVGNEFEGEIVGVSRVELAAIDVVFGEGEISTEEDAKIKIREEIDGYYNTQQKSLSYRKIMEHLVEINDLDLPVEFLERWLLSTNENLTAEQLGPDMKAFIMNLRWTLIKSKLAKKYDIEVTGEEITDHIRKKVRSYMAGNAGMDVNIDAIVEQYMQNQEQLNKEYEEVLAERVMEKVYDNVALVTKELTMDEFSELVKEANAQVK